MQVTKHASKGIHPDFVTQNRCHQKSKTGVSVAPQKDLCPPNFFSKKKKKKDSPSVFAGGSQIYFHMFTRSIRSQLL